MNNVWKFGGVLVLLLAFVGSYSLVSTMLDRTPPVVYERAIALKTSVPLGGSIDIEFQVMRSRICSADTKRWLTDVNGERHSIPSYTVALQLLAGRETYRRSISISRAAAIGPASYQVVLDYECNIFHRLGFPIRVVSPPITFQIGERTGSGKQRMQNSPADLEWCAGLFCVLLHSFRASVDPLYILHR